VNDQGNELRTDERAPVAVACLSLTLALLLVFPCLCAYAYPTYAGRGIAAAGVALGVNWCGGLLALLLIIGLRRGRWVLHGVLGAMIVRMFLPMVAGLVLVNCVRPLANAGVFGMIVVYYLVGLVVETFLVVRLVRPFCHRVTRVV
jgi:hypothetical protein